MQTPLQVDRVQSVRVNVDQVRLTLVGRWLDRSAADEEELLVVHVDGRRHRFTASREAPRDDRGHWSATFTLPTWAEPRHDGQAALWLGNAVIPVPLPRSPAGPAVAPALPAAVPAAPAAPPSAESEAWRPPAARAPAADPHRAGPLADLLLKETVAALRAELEQRTAAAVRTGGELADAQSELQARTAMQTMLEAGHREELAAAKVARDAAVNEVAGLRAELGRLGTELAATRERVDAEGGDLGEAQRLLADAKALAEQLRDQGTSA